MAFGVFGAVGTIIGVVQSAAGALAAGIVALAGSITFVQLGVGKGVKPKGKQRGKKRRALVWSGFSCAVLGAGLVVSGLTSLLHSALTDEPPTRTVINVSNIWQVKPDAPDAPVPSDREGSERGSAPVPTGPKQNLPDPSPQAHQGSSGSAGADDEPSKQVPNGVAPQVGPPADVARAKRKRSAALREAGSPLPRPLPVTPVDEAGGVAAPDEPGSGPASAPDTVE